MTNPDKSKEWRLEDLDARTRVVVLAFSDDLDIINSTLGIDGFFDDMKAAFPEKRHATLESISKNMTSDAIKDPKRFGLISIRGSIINSLSPDDAKEITGNIVSLIGDHVDTSEPVADAQEGISKKLTPLATQGLAKLSGIAIQRMAA